MTNLPEILEDEIKALQDMQNQQDLTIVKLCEPFVGLIEENKGSRVSSDDISTELLENPTPAALEADLAHYKELFSKLRFSYLEQVTKEKFIRAIVGDPPLIVEHQENVDLEESLAEKKIALKTLKTEVLELVAESEKTSRELSQKYQEIQNQTAQLRELPLKLQELESSIKSLKDSQNTELNPLMVMPLDKTVNCIDLRKKEIVELDRQIEQLQKVMIPRKTNHLERLDAELQTLEGKRSSSSTAAKEARRRKEESLGGVGDDLEERGRWWRGVETSLKEMLGV